MGKINVLDFAVANLIAAGEVVERPASAIKELVENSLDAGAKHISVEIKNGGSTLMRVSDDGCGMSRDDLTICIKRHATSKIKEAEDLDGIMTLGFRGEALAAIASVSKLKIITKTREEATGLQLIADYGEVKSVTEIGCHDGTTVNVEGLFSNVPARRKFLKRDITEANAVAAVIEKLALSHPEVAFVFISDKNIRIDTSGDGKLANAIYSVLGKDFYKNMIPVSNMTEGISVEGYISSPDYVRGNRNCENFFINGRYIKSNAILGALEEAYSSYIPSERFPSCVLRLNIHPAFVDVNVHPTKLEVKFSNERLVFNAVYCAVRNALTERVKRPEMELKNSNFITGREVRVVNAFTPIDDKVTAERDRKEDDFNLFTEPPAPVDISPKESKPVGEDERSSSNSLKDDLRAELEAFSASLNGIFTDLPHDESKSVKEEKRAEDKVEDKPVIKEETVKKESYEQTPKPKKENLPYYRIIGCYSNAYILVEMEDRMMIVDKHAAHERILFEEMKRNMYSGKSFSQMLLVPISMSMSPNEIDALVTHKSEIEKIGLGYTVESDTVSLNSYPAQLDIDSSVALLQSLAGGLSDGTSSIESSKNSAFEKVLYSASCKAAMKAGRVDSGENIKWIIEKLVSLPDIRFCPHGRPVAYDLTMSEIERQFKRT